MKKRSSLFKLTIFTLIYIFLSALLYYYFTLDKNERIKFYLKQRIEQLYSEFMATKNTYQKLSNFTFEELLINRPFLEALEKKETQRLYTILKPHYTILKRYLLTYLRILDPSGKPLLSMHKPTKKQKRDLFEDEQNELVLEFKRPIYKDGKFIGTIESAISYNVLKQELSKLFKGYYEYIINGSLINTKVFDYGNYLFIQSDLHPNYFYEESSVKLSSQKEKALLHTINSSIQSKVAPLLPKGKNFAIVAKANGHYYSVSFLAINKNSHIGYLISYKEDDNIAIFDAIFWQNIISGNIILIILLSFIYYFLHTKSKFEKMAVTDKLTGLYNRHKFYQIARQEMQRAIRHNRPLSLILFDIDHFKQINDTYGHDVGDYVLKTIAKILKKNMRRYDYAFRWGGEEFIILAPETDAKGAMRLADKIREIIASYPFEDVGRITVSLGVSLFLPQSDKNIDDVIKRADNALYISKQEGRNRATLS